MKRHHKHRLIDCYIRSFGFNCFYCSLLLCSRTKTIEHLIPASKGGKLTEANTTLACRWCNKTKDDKTYDQIDITSIHRFTHYRRILDTLQTQKRLYRDSGQSYLLSPQEKES